MGRADWGGGLAGGGEGGGGAFWKVLRSTAQSFVFVCALMEAARGQLYLSDSTRCGCSVSGTQELRPCARARTLRLRGGRGGGGVVVVHESQLSEGLAIIEDDEHLRRIPALPHPNLFACAFCDPFRRPPAPLRTRRPTYVSTLVPSLPPANSAPHPQTDLREYSSTIPPARQLGSRHAKAERQPAVRLCAASGAEAAEGAKLSAPRICRCQ